MELRRDAVGDLRFVNRLYALKYKKIMISSGQDRSFSAPLISLQGNFQIGVVAKLDIYCLVLLNGGRRHFASY